MVNASNTSQLHRVDYVSDYYRKANEQKTTLPAGIDFGVRNAMDLLPSGQPDPVPAIVIDSEILDQLDPAPDTEIHDVWQISREMGHKAVSYQKERGC